MGTGYAAGERKALEAAQQAISSPLLEDSSIEGATGILINITGGPDLTLSEIHEAASLIQEAAHEDANIIFGSVVDANMEDQVRITVIATGFDREQQMTIEAQPPMLNRYEMAQRGQQQFYLPSTAMAAAARREATDQVAYVHSSHHGQAPSPYPNAPVGNGYGYPSSGQPMNNGYLPNAQGQMMMGPSMGQQGQPYYYQQQPPPPPHPTQAAPAPSPQQQMASMAQPPQHVHSGQGLNSLRVEKESPEQANHRRGPRGNGHVHQVVPRLHPGLSMSDESEMDIPAFIRKNQPLSNE
jgi:hypothetical protein